METTELPQTDFAARVDATMSKFHAAWEEFAAYLSSLPAERECPSHPGVMASLDRENCRRHEPPVYVCQKCEDAKLAAVRRKRLLDAGIPEDAIHATLENFDIARPDVKEAYNSPQSFVESARKFAAGEIRNLLLAGTPGIGKGHLAAALAIAASDAGQSIQWATCSEVFNDCHAAYADNSMSRALGWYQRPKLLVLDEICLRALPADGEEILFAIFEYRHKNRLPSILLGNKPADDTRNWIGARILDRLRSGGVSFRYGEWASMRGTDKDGCQFEI
jgi:DNA replication protein DnaC